MGYSSCTAQQARGEPRESQSLCMPPGSVQWSVRDCLCMRHHSRRCPSFRKPPCLPRDASCTLPASGHRSCLLPDTPFTVSLVPLSPTWKLHLGLGASHAVLPGSRTATQTTILPRSGAVARAVRIVVDVGERPVRGEEHGGVLDELEHLALLHAVCQHSLDASLRAHERSQSP